MFDTLPLIAGAASAAATASIYYATYAVRSQWLGPTLWRGRADTMSLALTFDDGPGADTEHILDILARHNLSATFFMIGRHVERFPEIASRIVAEGHEIGNHSYSHPIFLYQSPHNTREQLARTQAVIEQTTGVSPRLARPPCGVRTPAYFTAARELGLRTVQWDVAGHDWKLRSGERIAHQVLEKARAGSFILLHDGDSEGKQDRRQTVVALELIIAGLRRRGLRVAPLKQLLVETEIEPGSLRKTCK
jgi:peptidoglycan/xylan/chitin deacetylase (PgdA/CDA1 family)